MDPIRQALERARAGDFPLQGNSADPFVPFPIGQPQAEFREVKLKAAHLEANRIVAYNPLHESGRYFDMLRTQMLQTMDEHGWQILAVTSPTAGCGKSVTACNLAMSVARLPERSVLLVDLDLDKPKVAEYLGIDAKKGILSVLEGRTDTSGAILRTSIAQNSMLVLPGEICKSGTAEWMASQAMTTTLQGLRRDFPAHVIILDMPPVLVSDHVISVLPQIESILLVTGIGTSTAPDIKECFKHIKSTPVVRVVVNKVSDKTDSFYGCGYY